MELILDKDLVKAWDLVEKLEIGEIFTLTKIPYNRRALFIRCIKQRIDTLNDCEFNGDYTKIRKLSDFCNFDLNNQNISKWKTEAAQEKMQVENVKLMR
jgi:hypothetical protein